MNAFAQEAQIHRNIIVSYVYRLIGSVEDAKDITQETIIRYVASQENEIENPRAWMFKVASNLAFDFLRKSKKMREAYIGPWLPEPYIEEESAEDKMQIDESLSMAFFILMESLSYKERMAYTLYEIFEFKHKEIADILLITSQNSRKLISRANQKIKDFKNESQPVLQEYQALTTQFIQAIKEANVEALQKIFTQDITIYSDGGGKAIAARRVLYGDDIFISKFLVKVVSSLFIKEKNDAKIETYWFNGSLGVILKEKDLLKTSFHFQIKENKISQIAILRNPEKLKYFK